MPIAIPAIPPLGTLIVTALIGTAISIGITFVAQAIFPRKKPQFDFGGDVAARKQILRSPAAPQRVIYGRAFLSGVLVFAESENPDKGNSNLHMVLAVAGHEVEEFEELYLNDVKIEALGSDDRVIGGRFEKDTRISVHLGDESVADGRLVAETKGWTKDHVGRGIAYVYVRLTYDNDGTDRFPTGIPTPRWVVKGRKMLDPRDGMVRWSDNPAICILDYLVGTVPGEAGTLHPIGYGATYPDDVDVDSFVAAANICDEPVPLPGDGGNQSRYTCNGSFTRDRPRGEIVEELLTSCAGKLIEIEGRYSLFVGAPATVTRTALVADDLAGPLNIVARPPRSQKFNTVRGTFISKDNEWTLVPFPDVTEDQYRTDDDDPLGTLDRQIELLYTNDQFEAQRLAQIFLKSERQAIVAEGFWKLNVLDIAPYDVVPVTLSHLAWTDKEFRVIDWELMRDGRIRLCLKEEDSTAYDWDPDSAEEIDPNPDTDYHDPWFMPPPGIPNVVEELYWTRDEHVRSKVVITWAPADSPFVREYEVSYRVRPSAGSPNWTPVARVRDPNHEIFDLAPNTYQFRVIAVSQLGVKSDPAIAVKVITGLAALPSDVAVFAYTNLSEVALLRWTPAPDFDVKRGGFFIIRHTRAAVPQWHESRSIIDPVPGDKSDVIVPNLDGHYLIKARDVLGQHSENETTVAADRSGVLYWQTISTHNEHPTYSGVLTDLVVSSGALQLDSEGDVDAWADWDTIADVDLEGGTKLAGTYLWRLNAGAGAAGYVDLGVGGQQCRLTVEMNAIITGGTDPIDSRPLDVDSWEDWDGDDFFGVPADIVNYVRHTDDDPSGTPSWSVWYRIEVGEFSQRGYQFKSEFVNQDPAYNIETDFLQAHFEELEVASFP